MVWGRGMKNIRVMIVVWFLRKLYNLQKWKIDVTLSFGRKIVTFLRQILYKQGLSCISHTIKNLQTTKSRGKWSRWEPWRAKIQQKRKLRRTKPKTGQTFRHHLPDVMRRYSIGVLRISERWWRKARLVLDLVLLIFLFHLIVTGRGSQRRHFPQPSVVWRSLLVWQMQESPCPIIWQCPTLVERDSMQETCSDDWVKCRAH